MLPEITEWRGLFDRYVEGLITAKVVLSVLTVLNTFRDTVSGQFLLHTPDMLAITITTSIWVLRQPNHWDRS